MSEQWIKRVRMVSLGAYIAAGVILIVGALLIGAVLGAMS